MNIRSSEMHERFWSKVDVCESLRCWHWRGHRDENGYGKFLVGGKCVTASRVAFFLRNGEWPNHACHKCDNPPCCNPDHIFSGTHQDNMRDMMEKRRHKAYCGERHGSARLTDKTVLEIRKKYKAGNVSMINLAKQYGVSFSSIQRVLTRKTWRHLP